MTNRSARTVLLVRALAGLSLVPLLLVELSLSQVGNVQPGAAIHTQPVQLLWLDPVVAALIVALYLLYWFVVWPDRRTTRVGLLLVAGMAGLATGYEALFGPSNNLWLYVVIVSGNVLRPRWAVPAVLLMAAVAAGQPQLLPGLTPKSPPPTELRLDASLGAVLQLRSPLPIMRVPGETPPRLFPNLSAATITAFPLLVAGLGATMVTFLASVNRQLRATRATQAQLAVAEERARVARDLHDLLGHNLSLMSVKLQVAERLIGRGDPQASAEVRDVARLTRDALRDVRETVSGYRQPTLDAELAGAGIALDAAGITLHLTDHHGVLGPEVEATCAWIIREATTNVIKHSRASTCTIDLARDNGTLTVHVADDGIGTPPNGDGSGVRGLRERVTALGGTLIAKPIAPGNGFRLSARIPIDPAAANNDVKH